MNNSVIGKIVKITGAKILAKVSNLSDVEKVSVKGFAMNYVSIGSLVGTNLVDGRVLILTIEEEYENNDEVFITAAVSGIYDAVSTSFSFGTDSYPLMGEQVFKLNGDILTAIFSAKEKHNPLSIGTYVYDSSVPVGYDPDVLFGKHLGVFGNTGSGKTCSVVSIIQRYINANPNSDIKFIILDVNGEYRTAFPESEAQPIAFEKLRFHHSSLSYSEYGRLFRAAEGIQYPAIKSCIADLSNSNDHWNLSDLPSKLDKWVEKNKADDFSGRQLIGNLRSMVLRIDGILEDGKLMRVINSAQDDETLKTIIDSPKKVAVLDLQISSDTLDIIVYLLFKVIYQFKSTNRDTTHVCLVLEEAHRYINTNAEESKLGSYYIDKISREGRKYGLGMIISSQVPSMLDHEIVSQCNSVIMHKITSKRDLEFLRNVIRVSSDTFYLRMSALEKQHAIVCGEAFPNDTIVRIHAASPLPKSNDPVIEDRILGI